MIWICFLALCLAAAPFAAELSRRTVTDDMRQKAPGQFTDLSQGKTHYRWDGPKNGPICICVHGLTTPCFVWRGLIPHLKQMGFRTLSYDLYGRGFSDNVTGKQNSAFFIRQLEDLMRDQGIQEPVTLVGYSMGGAISTAYAHHAPQNVKRLILIAPAGMATVGTALARFCVKTPLLGSWLMHLIYPAILRHGLKAEAGLSSSVPDITKLQAHELQRRGFLSAVLSSLRHALSSPMGAEHQALADCDVPVLAIWGKEDSVIPLDAKDILTNWNAKVIHDVVPCAGHGLTYTHTDDVADAIRDFIKDTA